MQKKFPQSRHRRVTYVETSQKTAKPKSRLAGFWLAWSHGGGITGTCGRPVFWQIGESGRSASGAPLPPKLP